MNILESDQAASLFELHRDRPSDYPFLLESSLHNQKTGRYSLLLTECADARVCRSVNELPAFLTALGDDWAKARQSAKPTSQEGDNLPFHAGWFVFLAYEVAAGLWPHLDLPVDEELPLAMAVYCGGALVADHARQRIWSLSESGQAHTHLEALAAAPSGLTTPLRVAFEASDGAAYQVAVSRAVDYIMAGDIYQANLSRHWQSRSQHDRHDMLDAYARLRQFNASGFAASVHSEALCLASASPERLFSLVDGRIETRPIAGTRPRGHSQSADQALRTELLGHPKERAEHIMLVDLERNDLGRICAAGTVRVDELLGLESYASVHHIVSNVQGLLRADVDLTQILAAVFPGGTITGCPKLRCMQIIAELESQPRGAYTGAVGYLSNCGRADFNILIRTLVWSRQGMHFNAGAGIVADSVAAAELAETEAKAAGMMRALQ